jgi:zinc and cadmium transporter
VGGALAFSAGVFVCIALSDLLPEVEFHSHDRVPLSLAFLAGLVLSWAIGFLEPEHSHGGPATDSPSEPARSRAHDHDHDHDHG